MNDGIWEREILRGVLLSKVSKNPKDTVIPSNVSRKWENGLDLLVILQQTVGRGHALLMLPSGEIAVFLFCRLEIGSPRYICRYYHYYFTVMLSSEVFSYIIIVYKNAHM